MASTRAWIAGFAVATAAAAGGYFVGRGAQVPVVMQALAPAPATVAQTPAAKPLYYQDPDGKSVYSASPRKTADGRDFKPVYGEQQTRAGGQSMKT